MEENSTLTGRLARALRVEVARADYPIARLALDSGITRPTLTRRLRGQQQITVPQLVAITDALGVTPCSVIHAALKDTPCKS